MASYKGVAKPAPPVNLGKEELVESLLRAKDQSGKTYDEIAAECGWTNGYTAALFYNQAQLYPGTVDKLKKAVPALSDEQLRAMQRAPMRSFPDDIIQDPLIYRIYEATMHYGEPMKALINEKFGDGIMSAINLYLDVDKVKGKDGGDRVVITFNGKFLPHIEQKAEDNTAKVASTKEQK